LYHTAQDNYKLIDTKSSNIDVHTRQEYIKHLSLKVNETNREKKKEKFKSSVILIDLGSTN